MGDWEKSKHGSKFWLWGMVVPFSNMWTQEEARIVSLVSSPNMDNTLPL